MSTAVAIIIGVGVLVGLIAGVIVFIILNPKEDKDIFMGAFDNEEDYT